VTAARGGPATASNVLNVFDLHLKRAQVRGSRETAHAESCQIQVRSLTPLFSASVQLGWPRTWIRYIQKSQNACWNGSR
jgi:hypothetical protein